MDDEPYILIETDDIDFSILRLAVEEAALLVEIEQQEELLKK